MLLFCVVFGAGISKKKIPLDLPPSTSIAEFKLHILKQVEGVVFKRILFAGKSLSDDSKTLAAYNLQKESTVQIFATRQPTADEELKESSPEDEIPPSQLVLSRQPTVPPVRLGDVLIIKLAGAQNLEPRRTQDGYPSSDPYVILSLGKQIVCSSIVQNNLNPEWNDLFGMVIEPEDSGLQHPSSLSIICMDNASGKADEPLGAVEISLADVPQTAALDRFFPLDGAAHGEISLSLEKAPLSSPELKQTLLQLINLGRAWTEKDLQAAGVSVQQLLGLQPWAPGSESGVKDVVKNPALEAMERSLLDQTLTLSNHRTLQKVSRILLGQKAIQTSDLPSRSLWISQLVIPEKTLRNYLQEQTRGGLKHLVYLSHNGNEAAESLSTAYALFSTPETALKGLLALHWAHKWRPLVSEELISVLPQIGFGTSATPAASLRGTPEIPQGLVDRVFIRRGDFFLISGPHEPETEAAESDNPPEAIGQLRRQPSFSQASEWNRAFFTLSGTARQLEIFTSLQEEPVATLPLRDCLLQETGAWSFQLISGYKDRDADRRLAFFARADSSALKEVWVTLFNEIRAADATETSQLGSVETTCCECNQHKPLVSLYRLDSGREVCFPCIRGRFFHFMKTDEDILKISDEFSAQDLSDVLSKREYHDYLDSAFRVLLKQGNQYVTCPSCEGSFEVSSGDLAMESSFLDTAEGLDEQPLTPEAKKHCLEHRFTCRDCLKNFCTRCKEVPYHIGFTCSSWKLFQNADKCRFCELIITQATHECEEDPSGQPAEVPALQIAELFGSPPRSDPDGWNFTQAGSSPQEPLCFPPSLWASDLSKGFVFTSRVQLPSPMMQIVSKFGGSPSSGGFILAVYQGRLAVFCGADPSLSSEQHHSRWLLGPRIPLNSWCRISMSYQKQELMLSVTTRDIAIYDVKSTGSQSLTSHPVDLGSPVWLTPAEGFRVSGFIPSPLLRGTILLQNRNSSQEDRFAMTSFRTNKDCLVYLLLPLGVAPDWIHQGFSKTPHRVVVSGKPLGSSSSDHASYTSLDVYCMKNVLKAHEICSLPNLGGFRGNYSLVCGHLESADDLPAPPTVALAGEEEDFRASTLYLPLESSVENKGTQMEFCLERQLKKKNALLAARTRMLEKMMLSCHHATGILNEVRPDPSSGACDVDARFLTGLNTHPGSNFSGVEFNSSSRIAKCTSAAPHASLVMLDQSMSRGRYFWEFKVHAVAPTPEGSSTGSESTPLKFGIFRNFVSVMPLVRQTKDCYNLSFAPSENWTWAAGDLAGLALDLFEGSVSFYRNGEQLAEVTAGMSGVHTWFLLIDLGGPGTKVELLNLLYEPASLPPAVIAAPNLLHDSSAGLGPHILDSKWNMDPEKSFTIFVKATLDPSKNAMPCLVSKRTSFDCGFQVMILPTGIVFHLGTGQYNLRGAEQLRPGQEHAIVVVVDQGTRTVQAFVNGSSTNPPIPFSHSRKSVSCLAPLVLGSWFGEDYVERPSARLVGSVSALHIWEAALTEFRTNLIGPALESQTETSVVWDPEQCSGTLSHLLTRVHHNDGAPSKALSAHSFLPNSGVHNFSFRCFLERGSSSLVGIARYPLALDEWWACCANGRFLYKNQHWFNVFRHIREMIHFQLDTDKRSLKLKLDSDLNWITVVRPGQLPAEPLHVFAQAHKAGDTIQMTQPDLPGLPADTPRIKLAPGGWSDEGFAPRLEPPTWINTPSQRVDLVHGIGPHLVQSDFVSCTECSMPVSLENSQPAEEYAWKCQHPAHPRHERNSFRSPDAVPWTCGSAEDCDFKVCTDCAKREMDAVRMVPWKDLFGANRACSFAFFLRSNKVLAPPDKTRRSTILSCSNRFGLLWELSLVVRSNETAAQLCLRQFEGEEIQEHQLGFADVANGAWRSVVITAQGAGRGLPAGQLQTFWDGQPSEPQPWLFSAAPSDAQDDGLIVGLGVSFLANGRPDVSSDPVLQYLSSAAVWDGVALSPAHIPAVHEILSLATENLCWDKDRSLAVLRKSDRLASFNPAEPDGRFCAYGKSRFHPGTGIHRWRMKACGDFTALGVAEEGMNVGAHFNDVGNRDKSWLFLGNGNSYHGGEGKAVDLRLRVHHANTPRLELVWLGDALFPPDWADVLLFELDTDSGVLRVGLQKSPEPDWASLQLVGENIHVPVSPYVELSGPAQRAQFIALSGDPDLEDFVDVVAMPQPLYPKPSEFTHLPPRPLQTFLDDEDLELEMEERKQSEESKQDTDTLPRLVSRPQDPVSVQVFGIVDQFPVEFTFMYSHHRGRILRAFANRRPTDFSYENGAITFESPWNVQLRLPWTPGVKESTGRYFGPHLEGEWRARIVEELPTMDGGPSSEEGYFLRLSGPPIDSLGSPSELGIDGSFTVEGLVRFHSLQTQSIFSVVSQKESKVSMGLEDGVPIFRYGKIVVRSPEALMRVRWYHLAFRFDETKLSFSIVVDGKVVAMAERQEIDSIFITPQSGQVGSGLCPLDLASFRIWNLHVEPEHLTDVMHPCIPSADKLAGRVGLTHSWRIAGRSFRDEGTGRFWGSLSSTCSFWTFPFSDLPTPYDHQSSIDAEIENLGSEGNFRLSEHASLGRRGLEVSASGLGGCALRLDGPAARATDVGRQSFSLSCLIHSSRTASTTSIISKRGSQPYWYELKLNRGMLVFECSRGLKFLSRLDIPDPQGWHHIAVVVDKGTPESPVLEDEAEDCDPTWEFFSKSTWTCDFCELVNPFTLTTCPICDQDCPYPPSPCRLAEGMDLPDGFSINGQNLSAEPPSFGTPQPCAFLVSEPLRSGLYSVQFSLKNWTSNGISLGVAEDASPDTPPLVMNELLSELNHALAGPLGWVVRTPGGENQPPAPSAPDLPVSVRDLGALTIQLVADVHRGTLLFRVLDEAAVLQEWPELAFEPLRSGNCRFMFTANPLLGPVEVEMDSPRHTPLSKHLKALAAPPVAGHPITLTPTFGPIPTGFHGGEEEKGSGGVAVPKLAFSTPEHASFDAPDAHPYPLWSIDTPLHPGRVYRWSLRIHKSADFFVGVSRIYHNPAAAGSDPFAWSFSGSGTISAGVVDPRPLGLGRMTTITLTLDFTDPELGILELLGDRPDECHSLVGIRCPPDGALYPSVHLWNPKDEVESLLPDLVPKTYVSLFLDGERIGREMIPLEDLDNDGPFQVGGSARASTDGSDVFDGLIRRVRLQKTARSSGDIYREFQRLSKMMAAEGETLGVPHHELLDEEGFLAAHTENVVFQGEGARLFNNKAPLRGIYYQLPVCDSSEVRLEDTTVATVPLPKHEFARLTSPRQFPLDYDSNSQLPIWVPLGPDLDPKFFSISFDLKVDGSDPNRPLVLMSTVSPTPGSLKRFGFRLGVAHIQEQPRLFLEGKGSPLNGPVIPLGAWCRAAVEVVNGSLARLSVSSRLLIVDNFVSPYSFISAVPLTDSRTILSRDDAEMYLTSVPGFLEHGRVVLAPLKERHPNADRWFSADVNVDAHVYIIVKRSRNNWVGEDWLQRDYQLLDHPVPVASHMGVWEAWQRREPLLIQDGKPAELRIPVQGGDAVVVVVPMNPRPEQDRNSLDKAVAQIISGEISFNPPRRGLPSVLRVGSDFSNNSPSFEGTIADLRILSGRGMYDAIRVCGESLCLSRADTCCRKPLSCGHSCIGFRGEEFCPPCLRPDCRGAMLEEVKEPADEAPEKQKLRLTQTTHDQCLVCLDGLTNAPCVVLSSCNHVFHKECMENRLQRGYPGKRITFHFAECPLCKAVIQHPELDRYVVPFLKLRQHVQRMSMERLEYEGLDKDPRLSNPSDAFFQDPEGFAMNHFSFYRCDTCRDPYFAGAAHCGPGGEDEEEEEKKEDQGELLCVKCQGVDSVESCKIHGTEWLSFKCRFCCKVSVWHCWNACHFCDSCHNDFQGYVTFTGENMKKLWEYTQCPGIRERMDLIKQNFDESEWETRMAKLVADPSTCPLGVRHLPNGVEYGLGCGLCAPQKSLDEDESQKPEKLERNFRTLALSPGVNSTGNRLHVVRDPEAEEKDGGPWTLSRSVGTVSLTPASEEERKLLVERRRWEAEVEAEELAARMADEQKTFDPVDLTQKFKVHSYSGHLDPEDDPTGSCEVSNILSEQPGLVHKSRPGQAFDLVLEWTDPDTQFALSELVLVGAGPRQFCYRPVKRCVAFMSSSEPDLKPYSEKFGPDFDQAAFDQAWVNGYSASQSFPVAFLETKKVDGFRGSCCLPNGQLGRSLPLSQGRFVHLRFLGSHSGDGIDISRLRIYGSPIDPSEDLVFPFRSLKLKVPELSAKAAQANPPQVITLAVPLPEFLPSASPEIYRTEYVLGLRLQSEAKADNVDEEDEKAAEEFKEVGDGELQPQNVEYALFSSGQTARRPFPSGSDAVELTRYCGSWGVGDTVQAIIDPSAHSLEYRVNGVPSQVGPAFFLPSDREVQLNLVLGVRERSGGVADDGCILISRHNQYLGASRVMYNFRRSARLPEGVTLRPLKPLVTAEEMESRTFPRLRGEGIFSIGTSLRLGEGMALEFEHPYCRGGRAALASAAGQLRQEDLRPLSCWTIGMDIRVENFRQAVNLLIPRPVSEEDFDFREAPTLEYLSALEESQKDSPAPVEGVSPDPVEAAVQEEAAPAEHALLEDLDWNCSMCTFLNGPNAPRCAVCETPKPAPAKLEIPAAEESEYPGSLCIGKDGRLRLRGDGNSSSQSPSGVPVAQWVRIFVSVDGFRTQKASVFVDGSLVCTLDISSDPQSRWKLDSKFSVFSGKSADRIGAAQNVEISTLRVYPYAMSREEVSEVGILDHAPANERAFSFPHGSGCVSPSLSRIGDFFFTFGGDPSPDAVFSFSLDPYANFHSTQRRVAIRAGSDSEASRSVSALSIDAGFAEDGSSALPHVGKDMPVKLKWLSHAAWDDRIWIYGGVDEKSKPTQHFWCFSPHGDGRQGEWEEVKTGDVKPPPLMKHSSVVLGDHLYMWGGFTEDDDSLIPNRELWRWTFQDRIWQKLSVSGDHPESFWGGAFGVSRTPPLDHPPPEGYSGSLWWFGGSDSVEAIESHIPRSSVEVDSIVEFRIVEDEAEKTAVATAVQHQFLPRKVTSVLPAHSSVDGQLYIAGLLHKDLNVVDLASLKHKSLGPPKSAPPSFNRPRNQMLGVLPGVGILMAGGYNRIGELTADGAVVSFERRHLLW